MDRPLRDLSRAELDKAFADQVTAGRRTPQPYVVAFEYIDGAYRPTVATDLEGKVQMNFLDLDQGSMTWLEKRVDEIVAIGKRR